MTTNPSLTRVLGPIPLVIAVLVEGVSPALVLVSYVAALVIGHTFEVGPTTAVSPGRALVFSVALVGGLVAFELAGIPGEVVVAVFVVGALVGSGPGLALLLMAGVAATTARTVADDGDGLVWCAVAVLAAAAALAARSQQHHPIVSGLRAEPSPQRDQLLTWPSARAMLAGLGTAAAALVVALLVTPLLGEPRAMSGPGAAPPEGWGIGDRGDILARPERTDDIVLFARSDSPHYWRATTLDEWDGRFWTSRSDIVDVVRPDSDGWAYIADGADMAPLVEEFEYQLGGSSVILTREGTYAVSTSDQRQAVSPRDDGTVRLFRSAFDRDEAHWIATHPVSPSPEQLRDADPATERFSESFQQRYLDTDALSPRIAQLATEITEGGPTSYDRAVALEAWFDTNMRYRLDSPLPPDGADPLEFLLLVDRTGYCEQMATSMVLMARSVGIPARVAAGWVTQEQRDDGWWVVRSENAHAWAELYFPGVGWVDFDPTDGVLPTSQVRTDAPDLGALTVPLLPLLGGLVGALALAWVVLRVRSRAGHAAAATRPDDWVDRAAERLYRLGEERECELQPDDTLRDFTARLREEGWDDGRLDLVVDRLSAAAYGPAPPSPDVRADVDEWLADLEDSHPQQVTADR